MGLHYDELSRWDERDYPLRRAVTQCFGKTAELMDVCTGGITSVMALEMAQKIWDDAAPKPVAIKAPEVTVETSMDHSSHAGESPYRAESYRPRAVEEVDPELGEILDRYGSEEDLDEEDDEEDEFDDEEEDEDDE